MSIPVSRFFEDQKIILHPNKPTHPLVSVIMPTYRLRKGGLTQRAIESVLNQSFKNFEFIIVDDGSLDGLENLLIEYQKKDPRIIIIRHEINCGLPAMRVNEGILISHGQYLAYMFEDDEWQPEALEHLLEVAEQYQGNCAVYGIVNFVIHVSDNNIVHRTLGDWDFDYASLKNGNKIANCAVLHPRSVLNICGLYDPHILARRLSDYDLWLRMAKIIPFKRCHHIIGSASQGVQFSLGTTIDHDLGLTLRYINLERNLYLTPELINNFDVDSLNFVNDPVESHRIREYYIIPYWERHAAYLKLSEHKLALISSPKQNCLLVTKSDYSTSIDVNMGNFDKSLSGKHLSLNYIPENYLSLQPQWNYDTLVLYRTIGTNSLKIIEHAHKHHKPVIYLMDDNMFKFGTGYMAEEFAYLKPDSPAYKILEKEVTEADLVISYSSLITRDIQTYNPRVVERKMNIRTRYIENSTPIEGGHDTNRKLKYAILSGPIRTKEIETLWTELYEFTQRHSNEIEIHFWGLDPSKFGDLPCSVYYRPFNNSYNNYLEDLLNEKFDFILTPLFDDHDVKQSKSLIKYLETTAAGAVGIYSDVFVYEKVQAGVTGLKTSNEAGAWVEALETSFQMKDSERYQMHTAAKNHTLQTYTTEIQSLSYVSIFEAAQLHASLSSRTAKNGHAAIAYFFHEALLGGATLHLIRHALIMKQYGFQPVLCFRKDRQLDSEMRANLESQGCIVVQLAFASNVFPYLPDSADLRRANYLREWLIETDIRLVHTVTFMADVATASKDLGIPIVATLHQYYTPTSSYQTNVKERPVSTIHSSSLIYAKKWQSVLEAPAFCIRAPVSENYFKLYSNRDLIKKSTVPVFLISGTLQERKGQKNAIEAVAELVKQGLIIRLVLSGHDNLSSDYVAECRQLIQEYKLEEFVSIMGFKNDEQSIYASADYLLCASTDESFPQSILKGMACGLRIVTTPVGGVEELIQDGFSGIVTNGFEVNHLMDAIKRSLSLPLSHWNTMLENAHLSVRMAASEDLVANKLLTLYNVAVSEKRKEIQIHHWNNGNKLNPVIQLDQNIVENGLSPIHSFVNKKYVEKRLPRQGSSYLFSGYKDNWQGLRLTFGNNTSFLSGDIDITIRAVNQPQKILRSVLLHFDGTKSKLTQDIFFTPLKNSFQKKFIICIKPVSEINSFICELDPSLNLVPRLLLNLTNTTGYLYGDAFYTN